MGSLGPSEKQWVTKSFAPKVFLLIVIYMGIKTQSASRLTIPYVNLEKLFFFFFPSPRNV